MATFGSRRLGLPKEVQVLERRGRELADLLSAQLDDRTGFALLLFDFGPGGNMSWISNAEREDMLEALKEMVARFEVGAEDTSGRES